MQYLFSDFVLTSEQNFVDYKKAKIKLITKNIGKILIFVE